MKVDFSISSKMTFMRECHITPNEMEIIVGVIMSQDEEEFDNNVYRVEHNCPSHIPNTSYLILLQESIGKSELRKELISLQNKGIILKTCNLPDPDDNSVGLKPNEIKFNKNILKKYIRHSGEMFWELFWAYPESIYINGVITSARNTFSNGGWSNLDEAASYYGQIIKFDANVHSHILKIIEEAKEKNLINRGLVSFLRGQEWINLENQLNNIVSLEWA